MSDIATVKLNNNQGWVKLEDLVKEQVPDFVFVQGNSYTIQGYGDQYRICVKATAPTDPMGGIIRNSGSLDGYTQDVDPLYVKCSTLGVVYINVSE